MGQLAPVMDLFKIYFKFSIKKYFLMTPKIYDPQNVYKNIISLLEKQIKVHQKRSHWYHCQGITMTTE